MFSRAEWKRMREIRKGLPEGERDTCPSCGALVVYETKPTELIVHHTHPWCERFRAVVEPRMEFMTANVVRVEDLAAEMRKTEQKAGN